MYNHPWVNKLSSYIHPNSIFCTTKLSISQLTYTSKASTPGKKIRRSLLQFFTSFSVSLYHGWDLLMMLAAGGQLAFDAPRRLRSSEFNHLHLLALFRLAKHLDDPPRT